MSKEQIAIETAKYITVHWESILAGVFSILASVIAGTWMVAKHWYEREIKLCKIMNETNLKSNEKEVSYLTKQLNDKNAYAQGVIEVMNQRLLGAKEEPARLLNIINDHESKLARLKNENEKLMSQLKSAKQETSNELSWFQTFDYLSLRDELENICDFNIHFYPDDDLLSYTCKSYKSYNLLNKSNDVDLKNVTPIIILLLKAQNQKMASLDIALSKCNIELVNINNYYHKSTISILEPLVSKHFDKMNTRLLFSAIEKKMRHKSYREEDDIKEVMKEHEASVEEPDKEFWKHQELRNHC